MRSRTFGRVFNQLQHAPPQYLWETTSRGQEYCNIARKQPFLSFRFFCLVSRYMQPEGLWPRLCRSPSRGTATFFSGIPISYPRTSLRGHSGSIPKISFSQVPPEKGKKKKTDRCNIPTSPKTKEKEKKETRNQASTPPSPPPPARHPPRPPARPPPRRPGPQPQERPSSPSSVGVVTSTPSLRAGRSSWPCRRQPLCHGDLRSLRTLPSHDPTHRTVGKARLVAPPRRRRPRSGPPGAEHRSCKAG